MALPRWVWLSVSGSTPWTGTVWQLLNQRFKALEQFVTGLLGYAVGTRAIPDEETQPLVTQQHVLVTANTVATTITGFRGGDKGQSIIVLAMDSNTTFQHSSTLRLDDNTDWVALTGESRQFFTIDGSNWFEVPRHLTVPDEDVLGTEALDALLTEAGDFIGVE